MGLQTISGMGSHQQAMVERVGAGGGGKAAAASEAPRTSSASGRSSSTKKGTDVMDIDKDGVVTVEERTVFLRRLAEEKKLANSSRPTGYSQIGKAASFTGDLAATISIRA